MVCGRQHRGRSEGLLHPEGEHIPFPGTDRLEAVPHGGGGEGGGAPPPERADSQTGSGRANERGRAGGGEEREVRSGEEVVPGRMGRR